MSEKPWLKKPGELYDKKGYPIYPGDLLRSPHFIGARRKQYYLYHVATYKEGGMHMTPTCWLHPDKIKFGGECLMSESDARECEIISGHGPGPILSYENRKRTK